MISAEVFGDHPPRCFIPRVAPKGDTGGTAAAAPQLTPFAPSTAPPLESFAGSMHGLDEGGGRAIFLPSLVLHVLSHPEGKP